jgi:hypothetical protein
VLCTRCGHPNDDAARFCSSCGAPLPGDADTTTLRVPAVDDRLEADDTLRAEKEGVPSDVAVLVVSRGPNAGSRYLLDSPVTTAGRHPDSDLFLDDVTVSRRHAEVDRTPDGYMLRDVGSLNGTYVNGERVEKHELRDGDVVQIGLYRLTFLLGDG